MFPCLGLAYRSLEEGEGMPVVMNAANEVAVGAFLKGMLGFTGIPEVVKSVMESPPQFDDRTIAGVLEGDRMARERAKEFLRQAGEVQ